MSSLIDQAAQLRNRPVTLGLLPPDLQSPVTGLVLETATHDVILTAADLCAPLRAHVARHETAHLLLGHTRSAHYRVSLGLSDPLEAQAESMASAWAAHVHWCAPSQARVALQAVEPLWEQLRVVDPAMSLRPLADPELMTDAETRWSLFRAVVEVSDWVRLLALRTPARLWSLAVGNTEDHIQALVVWIQAALTVYVRGMTGTSPGASLVFPADDLDDLVGLWSAVGQRSGLRV